MVQCKLRYADANRRIHWQSSTMLNFQSQRKLTLAFQPIRKAPQGHREPTHSSATATQGRERWPVYTSIHDVTGIRLLLLRNVYAQRGCLSPLTNARRINPASLKFKFTYGYEMMHQAWSSIKEVPYCFSMSSNNRASLLCCFKLCATFHSHRWIQTGVTVRKRPIWVKFDDF